MTPEAVEALRRGAETPVRAGMPELSGVARDLSDAFANDPVMTWFMRQDGQLPAARLKFFQMLTKVGLDDGEVLRPATGGAASIWIPSEKLGPSSLLDELRGLPTLWNACGGLSRLRRMASTRAAMEKAHPKTRHAYLWFIGVAPQAQGMGVGSRLLAAGLERVDAQGLPAYLESSNIANVPLYRRHGFVDTGEIEPMPGSPKLYAMWREARA